jgi:hypothetical protein
LATTLRIRRSRSRPPFDFAFRRFRLQRSAGAFSPACPERSRRASCSAVWPLQRPPSGGRSALRTELSAWHYPPFRHENHVQHIRRVASPSAFFRRAAACCARFKTAEAPPVVRLAPCFKLSSRARPPAGRRGTCCCGGKCPAPPSSGNTYHVSAVCTYIVSATQKELTVD